MITKTKFQSYLAVQRSGITNMFDLRNVTAMSGLTKEECLDIMKNYEIYTKQFDTPEPPKQKHPFEEILTSQGWYYETTGGGCDCWIKGKMEDPEGYLIMTDGEANIPTEANEQVTVGFYRGEVDWVGNDLPLLTIDTTLNEIILGKVEIELFKPKHA